MGAANSCIRGSPGPASYGVRDLSQSSGTPDCSLPGSVQSAPKASPKELDRCRDKQPLTRDSVSSKRAPLSTEGQKGSSAADAGKPAPIVYCDAGLGTAAPGQAYDVRISGPPAPGCDAERLATMQALNVLDAPPAAELDNILQLVCRIFNTENALIALFGDRRIYIRNTKGGFEKGDFPWRYSFCGWTMASEQAQIMVVNDAVQDARFKDNKFVKEMGVRFYCGTPLLASNGHRLGTLCFADTSPRPEFDESSCQILNNFAELVTRELERDLVLAMVKAKAQQLEPAEQGYRMLLRGIDCFEASLLLVDTAAQGWPLLHANTSWGGLTGHNCLEDIGKPLWRMFRDPSGRQVDAGALGGVLAKAGRHVLRGLACAYCPGSTFDLHFTRVNDTHVDDTFVPITVPTFTAGGAPPKRDLSTSYFFVRVEPSKAPGDAPGDAATPSGSAAGTAAGGRAGSNASSEAWRGDSAASLSSLRSLQRSMACQQLPGLELGVPIAAGSYGRVFKGRYQGETVAVKVLDANAITRRDALTGLSLEVLLAERLRHPFIVATKAWALVHGQGALPPRDVRVGESWSSGAHTKLDSRGQPLSSPQQPDQQEQADQQDAAQDAPAAAAAAAGAAAAGAAAADETAAAAAAAAAAAGQEAAGSGSGGLWRQGSGSDSAQSAHSSRCLLTPPLRLGSNQCMSEVSSGTAAGEGQTWLVMEYCDRGCLQDAVDRGWLQHPDGSVNLMAAIVTAHELACGLAHLHSLDIVHGDLSGFNVMLSSGGEHATDAGRGFSVRVGDFGLARDLGVLSKVETRTYGTITHMPPEVLAEGRLSKAADVYAFGVLLWQMLCGCRAWAGMSHAAVVQAVCVDQRHLEFPPDAPEGYVSLAQACMDHSATARPTFSDVLEVLEPLAVMARKAAAAASATCCG